VLPLDRAGAGTRRRGPSINAGPDLSDTSGMRSTLGFLLLVCVLGAGFVVGERLSEGEALSTHLVRGWTSPAPAPTPEPLEPPPEAPVPPAQTLEIVTGGEATIIEDAPGAFAAEPIPMYRYFDGSGAIRMVEGLVNVPSQYRASAVQVARDRARINRVEIPPPARTAFRDWEPEYNPNRGGVVLFSAAGCGACSRARQHLDRLGVRYEIRDIHSDSAAKSYVRQLLGRVVVPLLKVGGRHVSGYLPDEYDRLGRRG
jgi:glutaredoxin